MSILTLLWRSKRDYPGVYCIRNRKNGKVYIGSTLRTMRHRWCEHTDALSCGTHVNRPLQEDWYTFGRDAFVLEVLEIVRDPLIIEQRERYWQNQILIGTSYVQRRASMAGAALPKRRRSEAFFVPSNVAYTTTMGEELIGYVMARAVFADGTYAFEVQDIERLFKKDLAETVAHYRAMPASPLVEIDQDWVIDMLAVQREPAAFRQSDGTTAPAEYPVTADQRRV